MNRASIIGINRLRLGTDGHGIRTLVFFHGCRLSCKYCLNPMCLDPQARTREMSPEEVMQEIKKDELYYLATKGGVTFGGGEPLLNSHFIREILELGAKKWSVTIETSLYVDISDIQLLLPYVDEFIIDIKDMNPETYKKYTGKDVSRLKTNLRALIDYGFADKLLCRIPLIPGYSDEHSQHQSQKELQEMGIGRFDLFTYKTKRS